MAKDFSNVKWVAFRDAHRGSNFSSRMAEKQAVLDGNAFKFLGSGEDPNSPGAEGEGDHYSIFGYEFTVPKGTPREQVFAYAWYADKVLDDDGTPSDFE
jgi:hypothetical protein